MDHKVGLFVNPFWMLTIWKWGQTFWAGSWFWWVKHGETAQLANEESVQKAWVTQLPTHSSNIWTLKLYCDLQIQWVLPSTKWPYPYSWGIPPSYAIIHGFFHGKKPMVFPMKKSKQLWSQGFLLRSEHVLVSSAAVLGPRLMDEADLGMPIARLP